MLTNAKTGTVSRVGDTDIVIKVDDAELTWDKEAFHDVQKGDEVYIVAIKNADLDEERNEVAKAMINTVLQPKKDL